MSFVMLDKPLLRAIMWDAESFEIVKQAAKEAAKLRQRDFTVDLGRRHRRVKFDTGYAHDMIAQLQPRFDAAPPRKWPENREGEEP